MGNRVSMVTLTSSVTARVFAGACAMQWVAWPFSAYFQTEKFYDLTGSLTHLALVYWLFKRGDSTNNKYNTVQCALVGVWAARLGAFLFHRILRDGVDHRFDKARTRPSTLLIFWTLQGVWVAMNLLPTALALENSPEKTSELSTMHYVGWGVFALGFLIEAISDHQKLVFKSNSANKGKFITSGLWAVSRHPNYLGEIMCWSGLCLSALPQINGAYRFVSALGPLMTIGLLTGLSGIPLLEKAADKRWGDIPAYQEYKKNTPVLIPSWASLFGRSKTE